MFYTSYFSNMSYISKCCADSNKEFVCASVANSQPKGSLLTKLDCFVPSWDLVGQYKAGTLPWELFANYYIQQLRVLSVVDLEQIKDLPVDVILMCWESPDKPCHRHLLREFLNASGIPCEEFGTPHNTPVYDASEIYKRLSGG